MIADWARPGSRPRTPCAGRGNDALVGRSRGVRPGRDQEITDRARPGSRPRTPCEAGDALVGKCRGVRPSRDHGITDWARPGSRPRTPCNPGDRGDGPVELTGPARPYGPGDNTIRLTGGLRRTPAPPPPLAQPYGPSDNTIRLTGGLRRTPAPPRAHPAPAHRWRAAASARRRRVRCGPPAAGGRPSRPLRGTPRGRGRGGAVGAARRARLRQKVAVRPALPADGGVELRRREVRVELELEVVDARVPMATRAPMEAPAARPADDGDEVADVRRRPTTTDGNQDSPRLLD